MIHDSKRRYHTLPKRNDTNFKDARIYSEIEAAFLYADITLSQSEIKVLAELLMIYKKDRVQYRSFFIYIKTIIIFNQASLILNPLIENHCVSKIPENITSQIGFIKSLLENANPRFRTIFSQKIQQDLFNKLVEIGLIEIGDDGVISPQSRFYNIKTYNELYCLMPRINAVEIFDPES